MSSEKTYWSQWHIRANNHLGLSQRMLDFEWVDKQTVKGKLLSGYRQTLEKIIPILEAMYPGRWDIQYDTKMHLTTVINKYRPVRFSETYHEKFVNQHGGEEELEEYLFGSLRRYNYYEEDVYKDIAPKIYKVPSHLTIDNVYIVIHFPEVTITNSSKETLLLKDVFTKTKLYPTGQIGSYLQGARSTITIAEFNTNYCHSHLSSVGWYGSRNSDVSRCFYQTFCLGSSDLKTFEQMYNAHQNLADLESYFLMLQTVVSWESLEGGPHIKIRDTIQKSLNIPDVQDSDKTTVLDRITSKADKSSCAIDWVIRNGEYTIIDNERFEDFLKAAYGSKPSWPIGIYKDETGNYFSPINIGIPEAIAHRNVDFIPFRGQKFYLKIEGELKLVGNHKWYINPKIKEYVKHKFESACSKVETKKYTIDWLNQVSNNRTVS